MSRFSIIIPVYNVEQYLDECVNSVLAQTYTDFEVLLVGLAFVLFLSQLDRLLFVMHHELFL